MKRLSLSRYLIVAGLTGTLAAISAAGAQPAWAGGLSSNDVQSAAAVVSADAVLAADSPLVGDFTGDEFDGPAGAAPNPAIWTYDVGGGGWGNQEDQTYTNSRDNSYLDGNGHLVISALHSGTTVGDTFGSSGVGYVATDVTSARLTTRGKGNFTYGLMEARIKFPKGQGLSAAFWLLGTKVDSIGWPKCGEIDVVETINQADFLHDGIHGPGYPVPHFEQAFNHYGMNLSSDFHTYGINKQPGLIQILFDDKVIETYTPETLPSGAEWAFDVPMYAVLNIAVGGVWPGAVAKSTPSPSEMIVDWVRVTQ